MVYESLHNKIFLNQFPGRDSLNIYTYAKRIQQYYLWFLVLFIVCTMPFTHTVEKCKWTSCRGCSKPCWKRGREEVGQSRDTAWLWTEKLSLLVIWLVKDYSKIYQWLRRNTIRTQLILLQNSCIFLRKFHNFMLPIGSVETSLPFLRLA